MWNDDSLLLTPERAAFIKKSAAIIENVLRDDIRAGQIMGKLIYVLLSIRGETLSLDLLRLFCEKAVKNGIAGSRLVKAYEQYCLNDLGRLYRLVVEEDSALRTFVLG